MARVSTQINLRFDDATVAALDALGAEQGLTRAEVVRDAVRLCLDEANADRAGAAYRQAYADHPETAGELDRAKRSAARLTTDEPWEPWW